MMLVCAPMLQNHPGPLVPIHPFTKKRTFIVSRIVDQHLVIHFTSSSRVAYKPLSLIKKYFYASVIFILFVSSFVFIAYLFHGLAGAYINPSSIFTNSLFMHSLHFLVTQWISAKLGSALPPSMLHLSYYFQPKTNVFVKGYYTAG